jgi:hypothetical protein
MLRSPERANFDRHPFGAGPTAGPRAAAAGGGRVAETGFCVVSPPSSVRGCELGADPSEESRPVEARARHVLIFVAPCRSRGYPGAGSPLIAATGCDGAGVRARAHQSVAPRQLCLMPARCVTCYVITAEYARNGGELGLHPRLAPRLRRSRADLARTEQRRAGPVL